MRSQILFLKLCSLAVTEGSHFGVSFPKSHNCVQRDYKKLIIFRKFLLFNSLLRGATLQSCITTKYLLFRRALFV